MRQVVRVRFSGFSKEEDEWVSLNRAVRERSIPLEHSECSKVNVGDLVLCFRVPSHFSSVISFLNGHYIMPVVVDYQENEDHALYCDAHVAGIERKDHDNSLCTCIFVVCFDHDNVEVKILSYKLCR